MKRKPSKAFPELRILLRSLLTIFLALTLCIPQLSLLCGGAGEAFAVESAESEESLEGLVTDPVDPTEPSEDPADPTDPAESAEDPAEDPAAESEESLEDLADSTDSADPAESSEPSGDSEDPVEPEFSEDPSESESPEDPSKDPAFNLFEEVGEIPDGFVAEAEEIIRENWEDTYFSSIAMTLGEQEMTVDGKAEQLSSPATELEGELLLPIVDIAEAAGAEVRVDDATGDISIEDDGKETTVERSLEASRQADSPEGAAPRAKSLGATEEPSFMEGFDVDEDGIITGGNGEGGTTTEVPACTPEEAEEMLGLEVRRDGDRLTITKPYQLKQIVLYSEDPLQDTYGAVSHVTDENGLNFLQYASEERTKEAFEAFGASADVKYLDLNGVVASTALSTSGRWGSRKISADPFKEHLQKNGKTDPVTVAVVDTGVDASHPFLQGRTVAGYDFVNNDADPFDDHYHGTHVSGTVVDCTPENVKIMPVKVLGADGYGTELSVSLGVKYAADKGADIVNMSLSAACSAVCLMEQAVDYAEGKGTLAVAAAGNDSQDTALYCPAKLDNVITVTAVDSSDFLSVFSNYGDAVDVAAPGQYVESCVPGGGYRKLSGTSMAAPHVSAAAAMLVLEHPDYTPGDLREAVRATAVDLNEPGWDRFYGTGRLDLRILLGAEVPTTGVRIFQYPSTVEEGYSEELIHIVDYSGSTDKSVRFTSSDESVAVYAYGTPYGKILGKSVGTAVITATTAYGQTASCTVEVVPSGNWIDYAADSYAGGTGTLGDPYQIATPEQLAKLARDVAEGNYYRDGNFKLTADIDLAGKLWVSISNPVYGRNMSSRKDYYFQGNFDGNHHVVSNMKCIEKPDSSGIFIGKKNGSTGEGSGLFGGLGDPADLSNPKRTIQNLAIINADVVNPFTWSASAAGILSGGHVSTGTVISNCYTTGKVSGGGLIADGTPTIVNCFSLADVFSPIGSSVGIGGLAHDLEGPGTFDRRAVVSNSYFAGHVIDKQERSTGFVARIGPADIINSFAASRVPYGSGFVGQKFNEGHPSIRKSYYLSDNLVGFKDDPDPDTTDLEPRDRDFFKDPETYANPENWDSAYPWDFEDVWAMDPDINGGLPYLKTLPLPPDPPTDVAVEEVSLTRESLTIEADESETLIPVVWPQNAADREVSWQSSDTSVATVDVSGRVSAVSPGTSDVTVTTRDGGKTATCAVTVVPVSATYELTVVGGTGAGSYKKGKTVGVVVDEPPDGYHFSHWTADDPEIAFADPARARTTLVMPGRAATVTAVFAPGYTLTVFGGQGSGYFEAGKTVDIYTAESFGKHPDKKFFIRWSASDPGVVFADPEAASTSFVMPSANVTVTAVFEKIRVESVSLDKTSLTLEALDSGILKASILPKNAGDDDIIWSSSDTSVAVAENWGVTRGRVTALAPGIVEITVTTRDGGKQATCVVTVVPSSPTYELTVVGGAGSGSYKQGRTVSLQADKSPVGHHFSHWSTDDPEVVFAFPASKSTTFVMPGRPATVTAVFVPAYQLTVVGGAGSGSYEQGRTVRIVSDKPPVGHHFSHWSTDDPDITFANSEAANTTFVMPGKPATVTAVFVPGYILTVVGGTGTGSYEQGRTVRIEADKPPVGHHFSHWSTDDPEITFANSEAANTTFVMPGRPATVTAVFVPAYQLTVVGGAGSGSYEQGRTVRIVSDKPPVGHHFSHWSTDDPEITFANSEAANTTFVMPGKPATVTAAFEKIPVESVSFSKTSLTLKAWEFTVLTASVLPEDVADKYVTWSSSDTSVADVGGVYVDMNGRFCGTLGTFAPGTAVITATTRDGGKTAKCTVMVVAPKLELEAPVLTTPTRAMFRYSLAKKTYNGSAQGVTVKSKTGAGAVTAVYYDGSKAVPRNAGSYAVTVDVAKGDGVRAGRKIPLGTFTITKVDVSKARLGIADAVWSGRQIRPVKFTYNKASFATKTCASSVSYGANKNIGKGTITFTGKGNFTGKRTFSFKILPRKMYAPTKAVVGKRQAKVSWRKSLAAQKVTGYRLRWRAAGTKTWSKERVYKASVSSAMIKGLKKGQRYEFQVRNCRTVGKAKYYGAWSNVRTTAKVK